jgi:lysophospholipase L1-like esterase
MRSSGAEHHRRLPMDDDAMDNEDDDRNNDNDNDVVPLVPRSRVFLEISRDGDDEDDSSCFSNSWKGAASLLMAAILLGPWVYSSYRTHRSSNVGVDASTFLETADSLGCAAKLNTSFSQLFQDIQYNRTGFCRDGVSCRCKNPTIPIKRTSHFGDAWQEAFERNQNMAANAPKDLDVVLVGDSIFEHWLGTDIGIRKSTLRNVTELWKSTWEGHAIPLAISADRCNQLLYRLQNGEIPPSLNPTAWWILIGTNDSGGDNCSREAILVGIMAVALEVMLKKPDASRIILQGLLPSRPLRLDDNPYWQDFLWVNARLKCMAEASSRLEYYDGTSLFLTEDGDKINQTLMTDYLHPSPEGYKIWSRDMIQKLQEWGIWSSQR